MLPTYAQNYAPTATPRRETAVEVLSDVLGTERKLLEELMLVMRKQRSAVADDDLQALDDSVFATYRVLATLGEARRRRKSVNRLLGGAEDMNVNDLEEILGDRATTAVIDARNALQDAAVTLSREVDMNKQVLRAAMDNGNDYVQKLFGAPQPTATYAAPVAAAAAPVIPAGVPVMRAPIARLTPAMVPTQARFLDRSV
ncbi:MAG: flagellar export chaperone FlgN [Gemmatimonadaceae bacterium]|nr:flagellar export chaperone FlgN [Gemmatimonadaceae bacterium]